MNINATPVFHDCWEALNETYINEDGKKQRKYRLLEQVGGSRSSKTWSNFLILYLYAAQNRNKIITVMRDTAADCRDKVEPDWQQWLKDPNARIKQYENGEISVEELDAYLKQESLLDFFKINKSEHSYTLKSSGSKITFTGTDDESRAIGKTQHVLWVNEPYLFSEEVFKQLSQRTSDFIIVDWNPRQDHFIEKLRLKDDTFTHRSTLLDNPFCPIESKKQILSYQPLKWAKLVLSNELPIHEAETYDFINNPAKFDLKDIYEIQRCIRNEQNRTASEYHWLVYGLGEKAEKPNKIYNNWKAITLEEYLEQDHQTFYGLDYGFANPSACVEVKYDGDMSFYIRPLLYKPMNQLSAPLGEVLKDVGVPSGDVTYIFADSSDREPGTNISMTNDLRLNYKLNAIPTNKPTYKERFEFITKCKIFFVSDKEFENEYENYEYEFINGFPTERPIKRNDHYMNATEYCIWGIKEYYNIMF